MTLISSYSTLLRHDLASFIAKTFQTVDPSAKYLPNWHIEMIAEYLMAASRGEITRLIINMPPRSLKSICVSVAWPAWLLGRDPTQRIMAASYSQSLSVKHSLDCRLVMGSPWYQSLFPEVELTADQNEKAKFMTTQRGFRFATSVGGTATGEGGDMLIMDDPHNPLQAASDVMRQQGIDWFKQTFVSRLNNKKRGAIVVVMQRLHDQDLTGYLQENSGGLWEHLRLPAIAEKPVTIYMGGFSVERKAGDILQPERESKSQLSQAKIELGSYGFAAQYQQTPLLREGGMVKRSWLRRYEMVDIEF